MVLELMEFLLVSVICVKVPANLDLPNLDLL